MKKKNKIFPNTTKNFEGRWDDETGENGRVILSSRPKGNIQLHLEA